MTKPSLGRIILTHIVVGPPVGTVAFMTFVVVAAMIEARTAPDSVWSFLSVMPMAVGMGYVLGAIPATVTSLVVAWAVRKLDKPVHWLLAAAAIGAVASCLGLFWVVLGPNGGESKWVVVTGIAFTGAVAALVSMLVVVAMTPRERTT